MTGNNYDSSSQVKSVRSPYHAQPAGVRDVTDKNVAENDGPACADAPGPTPISTRELFGKGHEVLIDHEGSLYRLRITRQGKLILNK